MHTAWDWGELDSGGQSQTLPNAVLRLAPLTQCRSSRYSSQQVRRRRRFDIDELLMLMSLTSPALGTFASPQRCGARAKTRKALPVSSLQSSHWAPNLKIASISNSGLSQLLSHCSSTLSDNIAQTVPQPYRMLYYAVLAQVWKA